MISTKTLCVTAAEGWTGHYVLQQAKESGHFSHILACLPPNPTKELPTPHGVEVCRTPHADVKSHAEAFKKADCVVLIPPASSDKLEVTKKMLEACKDAKVKHVVLATAIGHEAGKDMPQLGVFRHVEQMLQDSGIQDYAIVRLGWYAENILLYAEQIKHGELPIPVGADTKIAAVSAMDCARALVRIAQECGGKHHDKVYTITGEQPLSAEDMAKVLCEVTGKEIKFKGVSENDADCILQRVKGLDPAERQLLLETYQLARQGHLARTNKDYMSITGHPPTSFKQCLALHKDDLVK